MEEYYQQIGRAGRDGLESKCIMYCNSADFDLYKGDFYLGNLPLEMRSYQEMNIDALRQFAMSDDACRRAEILKFFNEKPSFGERCGTCDTCVTRATYSNDFERDFGENGARLTLYAISVLNNKQGIGMIENLIKGKKIESYRYKSKNVDVEKIQAKIADMKSRMSGYKSRLPVSYFTKDLLPALIDKNFVTVLTQSMMTNGRNMVSNTKHSSGIYSCSIEIYLPEFLFIPTEMVQLRPDFQR
jgi:superfamily II DNA helicase RecQ